MLTGPHGASACCLWLSVCGWQSLQSRLPRQDDVSGELGRNALIGFLATVVSDCLSNGFTVIKVRTAAQRRYEGEQSERGATGTDGRRWVCVPVCLAALRVVPVCGWCCSA